MTSVINDALLRLTKRAETNDRSKLLETFVNIGPLFTLLSNSDHQVLYGRRGTGKTRRSYTNLY
jgi:Cdc6-like AAA superfamily ATPase